tara:strand:+ start:6184 stop:6924 length:741 start_codon:yes stop_codon:yes gene_type:complete
MEIELSGDKPNGDVLFCSCDQKYFHDFAKPLAYTANENNNDLHIHVMNPDERTAADFVLLKHDLDINLTISQEHGGPENREYYSCNRFIIAPHLLQQGARRLMIIDADCLIMNHIEFPDADLGLFLRDPLPGTVGWEKEGTKCAAGMVYMTQQSLDFAMEVSTALCQNKLIWFIDQVALWQTYNKWRDKYKFYQFTEKDMDWEFIEGTSIWTGKGPRKYDNETYVRHQQVYRDMWDGAEERFWKKS